MMPSYSAHDAIRVTADERSLRDAMGEAIAMGFLAGDFHVIWCSLGMWPTLGYFYGLLEAVAGMALNDLNGPVSWMMDAVVQHGDLP